MKKQAIIALIIVSLGLIFAGSVSAEDPSVEVTVLDDQGESVETAQNGDSVTLQTTVTTGTDGITSPVLYLWNYPDELTIDPDNVWASPDNGESWYMNSDSTNGGFFYWDETYESYAWNMSWLSSDGNLAGDQTLILSVPVTVANIEDQDMYTVADLYSGEEYLNEVYYLFSAVTSDGTDTEDETSDTEDTTDDSNDTEDSTDDITDTTDESTATEDDTTSDTSDNITIANAETTSMQDTGVPIALAVMGILSIVGGTVYGRLR